MQNDFIDVAEHLGAIKADRINWTRFPRLTWTQFFNSSEQGFRLRAVFAAEFLVNCQRFSEFSPSFRGLPLSFVCVSQQSMDLTAIKCVFNTDVGADFDSESQSLSGLIPVFQTNFHSAQFKQRHDAFSAIKR